MLTETAIASDLQNIVFALLLSPGEENKPQTLGVHEASIRQGPGFEVFDLSTWNVLLDFLLGIAGALISDSILQRRKKEKSIDKETAVELISEIIQQIRKPDINIVVLCQPNKVRDEKVKREIQNLLAQHGWSDERAETYANTIVDKLLENLPKKLGKEGLGRVL